MLMHNTVKRVPVNTDRDVNRWIFEETLRRVELYAHAAPHAIDERLRELDGEWDIERVLEANAATAAMVGSWLGATVDRRFFAIPALVGGFLLQHAVQGWCPPLPILRRLGIRTEREIDYERNALKALRGDFERFGVTPPGDAHDYALHALQAAMR